MYVYYDLVANFKRCQYVFNTIRDNKILANSREFSISESSVTQYSKLARLMFSHSVA